MSDPKKRIPIDFSMCQAEKSNGNSFMTMGGTRKMVRCTNKPSTIVYETKKDEDGVHGAMALCHACKQVLKEQSEPGTYKFIAIDSNAGVLTSVKRYLRLIGKSKTLTNARYNAIEKGLALIEDALSDT